MATSRNRDYSAPPEGVKNVSALYGWDQAAVITGAQNPQTGAWSSLQVNPDGSLKVALTSGITIDSLNLSGINVNTDQLESINTSGTLFLRSISGDLRDTELAVISGTNFLASISGDLRDTEAAIISGTNFLGAISGRLINGLVGVTGVGIDRASGYSPTNFMAIGGRAVDIASGFNPTYASGANSILNIDRTNGAVLTEGTDLNYQYDSVTTYAPQGVIVSNSSISGSFSGAALQTGIALFANSARKFWYVQNTSSVRPLYVRLSSLPASSGDFNFILNQSSSAGQGGQSFSDDRYLGDVSVSGTSLIIWELT
jgi:hypothetical protein